MSVFGQLAIKSLFDCEEIQQEVMSFAFYDHKTAETKRNKKAMVCDINQKMKYQLAPGNYWVLNYRLPRRYLSIGGQIHGTCGNYYSLHSGEIIPRCVRCNCLVALDDENDV